MEIIVIGTEPPCIRCLTTYKRAKEVAQQFSNEIDVRKVAIHSEEAARYGKIESGHGISEEGNVKADPEKMRHIIGEINNLANNEAKNERIIDAKLKELDNVLLPVKEKAKELGYLMTPVLIINGQVKSMDYVPDKEAMRAWINAELKH